MAIDEDFRRNLADDVAKELEAINADPNQKKLDAEFEQETDAPAVDAVEPEDDGASGGGTEAKPQSSRVLASKLKTLGYDIDDDTNDDEIVEPLLSRLAKADQATKEAERKAAEAERKAAEAERRIQELAERKPEPKPAEQEPPKEDKPKRQSRPALVRPDAALEALVEWDEETRMFVGKERHGSIGSDAAKQFNEYRAARAKREQEIIDNPESLLEGFGQDIEERLMTRAEKLVEERLKRQADELRKQQEESSVQSIAQKEEDEFTSFIEGVKDKLYKLNSDGSIRQTLDGEPAWTEAGKLFRDEYNELCRFNPNALGSSVAKKAYERIARLTAIAPPKTSAEVAAEKKKSFVSKGRKHESGVPSSGNNATTTDKFNSGNKVRLWEALLEDESNDDNPDLAGYRK